MERTVPLNTRQVWALPHTHQPYNGIAREQKGEVPARRLARTRTQAADKQKHKVDNSLEVDRCDKQTVSLRTRSIRISYVIASQETRKERRANTSASLEHVHKQNKTSWEFIQPTYRNKE